MLDYMTLTSYEDSFYSFWLNEVGKSDQPVTESKQFNRYIGKGTAVGTGNLSIGSFKQPLGWHHAMVASGEAADLVRTAALFSIENHSARATRVDVQATIIQPAEWSQLRLFNRVESYGKHVVEMRQSVDRLHGRLATVYIGSRTSERFVRVYQKPSDDGLLLRCELQMSGGQSELWGSQWRQRKVREGDTLRGCLQWVEDVKLTGLYLPLLEGYNPQLPKYSRTDGKTDRWLLEQVLPVLARRLQAHDCSEVMRDMFKKVVNDDNS
jgi:hypothetical protein